MAEVARMDTPNLRTKRRQRLRKSHSLGGTMGRPDSHHSCHMGTAERLPGAPDSPPPRPAAAARRSSLKKPLVRTDTQIFNVYSDVNFDDFKGVSRVTERRRGSAAAPSLYCDNPPIRVTDSPRSYRSDKTMSRPITISTALDVDLESLTLGPPVSTDSAGPPRGNFLSCPDLGDGGFDVKERVRVGLPTSNSFHGRASERTEDGESGAAGRRHRSAAANTATRLTVPDIFTTSQTHSARPPRDRRLNDLKAVFYNPQSGIHRHSAPELSPEEGGGGGGSSTSAPPARLRPKPLLAKSLSDTPPRRSESAKERSASGQHNPLPAESGLLQNYRSDPVYSNVLDFLYIGNLESAYNVRLRCKLRIGSIVDLSNIPPDEVPASKKNEVPCTCTSTPHFVPAILRLNVCESDLIDIQTHFTRINKFIEGARERGKKALVVCYTGTSLSVLAVIQYLLHYRGMDLRKAYSQVMKGRSDIELSYAYFQLLQCIERQLYPASPQRRLGSPSSPHDDAEVFLPKEAWSDC